MGATKTCSSTELTTLAEMTESKISVSDVAGEVMMAKWSENPIHYLARKCIFATIEL